MATNYIRAVALEEAAKECEKWLARRKETLVEIYGNDLLEYLPKTTTGDLGSEMLNQAVAAGELYAYESLARAIRNLMK